MKKVKILAALTVMLIVFSIIFSGCGTDSTYNNDPQDQTTEAATEQAVETEKEEVSPEELAAALETEFDELKKVEEITNAEEFFDTFEEYADLYLRSIYLKKKYPDNKDVLWANVSIGLDSSTWVENYEDYLIKISDINDRVATAQKFDDTVDEIRAALK